MGYWILTSIIKTFTTDLGFCTERPSLQMALPPKIVPSGQICPWQLIELPPALPRAHFVPHAPQDLPAFLIAPYKKTPGTPCARRLPAMLCPHADQLFLRAIFCMMLATRSHASQHCSMCENMLFQAMT